MNDISTHVYSQTPKSITIKAGSWYDLTSGQRVKIKKIRTNGMDVVVYYMWRGKRDLFHILPSLHMSYQTLEQFKSNLIDLGSINELFISGVKQQDAKN